MECGGKGRGGGEWGGGGGSGGGPSVRWGGGWGGGGLQGRGGKCIGESYLGVREVGARVGKGELIGRKLHSLSGRHALIKRCSP